MELTTGLVESNSSLPPGGWLEVTCRLTESAPGPMRPILILMSMGELYVYTFICKNVTKLTMVDNL